MSKVTIEEIVPAKELVKKTKRLTRVKKVMIVILVIFAFAGGSLIYNFLPDEPKQPQTEQIKKLVEEKKEGETPTIKDITDNNAPGNTTIIFEEKINQLSEQAEILNENGDLLFNPEKKNYKVFYFPETQQFNISIVSSPFDQVRKTAEEDFFQMMGSDRDFVCSLNVVITTPRFANPNQAGGSYKLSFCE